MLYEEIRTKQDLSYISICSLSILYNSKFILMTTSLGPNAVVVMRVHCNGLVNGNGEEGGGGGGGVLATSISNMNRNARKPTFSHVRPTKAQISLRIHTV